MGSGLAGLPLKGVLPSELFTVFRNWLALGAVPRGPVRPQMSEHQTKQEMWLIQRLAVLDF